MEASNSPKREQSQYSGSLRSLWRQFVKIISKFTGERFSIIDLADPESTIEGIKKDVEFRGFSLWILIFSIIIASIGLNVNSPAVVIGAMLISPLMGPIMGVGLSLGINDFKLLKKSVKNLVVAVGIGLLASALYFLISPISEASNEILNRTNPTLLDVVVAFFGGLAGILAGSRKEKSNVIPGVAIATALMPPICASGFGLAHGDWDYFFGALYLFLINGVLIATATTVVTRYLKFPMATILDPKLAKKTRRWFSIGIVIVIIPSIWIFYKTVSNSLTERNILTYVETTVEDYPGTTIVTRDISFAEGYPEASVSIIGELIPEELVIQWENEFEAKFNGKLVIIQDIDQENLEMSKLINLYSEGREEVKSYQDKISLLESKLSFLEGQLIPINLSKEIKVIYPDIHSLSVGTLQGETTNSAEGIRIPVAFVNWSTDLSDSVISLRSAQLSAWLALRLEADSVLVK